MYKDILVPVDMSDEKAWRKPLETAIELVRLGGGRLHLMTVVPKLNSPLVGSYFPENFEQQMHERANQELHEFASKHVPEGLPLQTIVAAGTIYEEVIRTAEQVGCDLVVMGRSGSERASFLLGTNVDRVIRHATTSVLVAHD
ncbi:MAG: universal stress protein [Candidatus Competibacterales bacterium]|nr:universal stress protein [Candidatus Competibacterales bacterium]